MVLKMRNFLISLIFILPLCFSAEPMTGKILQSFNRLSSPTSSLKGDFLIYSQKKWNSETGKTSTNLMYTEVSTKTTFELTKPVEGQADTSPYVSVAFPNYVFFTRSSSEVSTSIYYIEFPPKETSEPKRLTSYEVAINDFKIKSNSIVFSADVYFSCDDFKCSAEKIKVEKAATSQVYDSLLMFHWDHWLPQGKGSHLFLQKIKIDSETKEIALDGDVKDLTKGMELNTPPLFTDKSNYDISRDGTQVAFSAHFRTNDEAWVTGWQTYYMDLTEMAKPVLITGHTKARTQAPQFSKDGTKIAYLAMKTPGLESEFNHFEIYNILSNKVDVLNDSTFDKGVNSFMWYNDNNIIFQTVDRGVNRLFQIDFHDVNTPLYSLFPNPTSYISYSTPFAPLLNNKILFATKVGYNCPERVVTLQGDKPEEVIVNLNEEQLKSIELPEHEPFEFTGGYGDQVYGWIIKPINFDEKEKYPVALLIHGGPESSWTSGWSYSWNPQIWAQQGYVVVLINPHGSTGVNSAFLNAVRNDWGGVPYEDIITGINYVASNYAYVNKDKMCALGGSYGGYMVNWIEGHNNDKLFKCLVNHDGAFSTISKFYATDELWFQKAEFCPRDKIGCNPFDGKEIRDGYEKNSPERYVKNWTTPMLVIHGGLDYRVPLTEALSTFTALQLQKVESKLLYFPLENHWVLKAENQIKWYDEVFAWLKTYLA